MESLPLALETTVRSGRPLPVGRLSAWQLRYRLESNRRLRRCHDCGSTNNLPKRRRCGRFGSMSDSEPSAPALSYNVNPMAHRRVPGVIETRPGKRRSRPHCLRILRRPTTLSPRSPAVNRTAVPSPARPAGDRGRGRTTRGRSRQATAAGENLPRTRSSDGQLSESDASQLPIDSKLRQF